MKKLLFILFISYCYIPQAFSFVCYNQLTGNKVASNGTTIIPIQIDSDIIRGENIFANVGDYIFCENQQPYFYVDHLELNAGGIIPGSAISYLDNGVYINGSRILSQNAPKTNIFSIADSKIHPIDIDMFFVVPSGIGSSLVIEANQTLMTLKLHKYSTPNSSHGYEGVHEDFTWTFVAANRAVLQAGSCDINNNEPIIVDFGLVRKASVKNTGADSVSKDVNLDIDCHDSSLNNQQVKVTLSAQQASFSNDFIAVSDNTDLGIEIAHNDQVIAPFTGFISYINNGVGNEQIRVSVVKKTTVNSSDLKDGSFNASGSLIVSLP
ncbi:fimbrial protein [Orbus mooreae]|uniref:fimbrial protein n=1 Tax=Orbus mooreae TaxID=3074107 RepID=UPI00370D239B